MHHLYPCDNNNPTHPSYILPFIFQQTRIVHPTTNILRERMLVEFTIQYTICTVTCVQDACGIR